LLVPYHRYFTHCCTVTQTFNGHQLLREYIIAPCYGVGLDADGFQAQAVKAAADAKQSDVEQKARSPRGTTLQDGEHARVPARVREHSTTRPEPG